MQNEKNSRKTAVFGTINKKQKKGEHVFTVYFPDDLYQKLQSFSRESHLSMAEIVRQCVAYVLSENEENET